MAYPAIRLCLLIVSGILLGFYLPKLFPFTFFAAVLIVALTGSAALIEEISKRKMLLASTLWTAGYPLAVILAFAAYTASTVHFVPPNSVLMFVNEKAPIKVVVKTEPSQKDNRVQWTASVEKIILSTKDKIDTLTISGNVRIRINLKDKEKINLTIGDKCWVNGRLTLPPTARNKGEFNYREFLEQQEIYALLSATGEASVKHTDEREENFYYDTFVLPAYAAVKKSIERLIKDGDEQSFIKGLLLGDRSGISDDVRMAFQKTGTMHVLAISGLHISLIAFILNVLLKRLNTTVWAKWLRFFLTVFALVLYSQMTGNTPPVKRAVIMAILFEFAVLMERKSLSLNTLGAAAAMMLIWNPRELFSLSFHLTNGAVAAIILIYPRLSALYDPEKKNPVLDVITGVGKFFWNALSLTIAATIGTTPFIAFMFGSVPMLGLFANLVIVDMTSLAVLSMIPAILFESLGIGISTYYALCAFYLIHWSIGITEWFSKVPFASVEFQLSAFGIVAFFLTTIAVLKLTEPKRDVRWLIAALVAVNIVIWKGLWDKAPQPIIMFSAIGRGNAVICKTTTESILIDAGTSEKQWSRINKQRALFKADSLAAAVQFSSKTGLVNAINAAQTFLRKDSVLKLRTMICYRPTPYLLKIMTKSKRLLCAQRVSDLKLSPFFKCDVALIQLRKFGEKEKALLSQWLDYANPSCCVAELSSWMNAFEKKKFYRYASTEPRLKTTERDGQLVIE
ncbi:MAG: hypothetical protein HY22_04295 [[Candidatus Thermochlorobacteriaceae] bacterium GBChlB]|nr:MAG: hypothetical protein HY22_04295 [[Candidatus Thermochlorobacteriaceae] bacterium GBChlB]